MDAYIEEDIHIPEKKHRVTTMDKKKRKLSMFASFRKALRLLESINNRDIVLLYREKIIVEQLDKLLAEVSAQGDKIAAVAASVADLKSKLDAAANAAAPAPVVVNDLSDADKATLAAVADGVAKNSAALDALAPPVVVVAPVVASDPAPVVAADPTAPTDGGTV